MSQLSSKSRCFEKNKIQDVYIYQEMSAAASKYLQKSGDELRSI